MSVINEQQGSLPRQPKGVDIVMTDHEFNPANGHYEPVLAVAPANIQNVATSGGSILFTVPATVNQRWVYGVIAIPQSGDEYVQLSDSLGANKLPIQAASGVTFILMSTPGAPLFTVNGGLSLLATPIINESPMIIDLIYIDK